MDLDRILCVSVYARTCQRETETKFQYLAIANLSLLVLTKLSLTLQ